MEEDKKCFKCGGKMIKGGLYDRDLYPIIFCEDGGKMPSKKLITGFNKNIFSYTCETCGYIEIYKIKK